MATRDHAAGAIALHVFTGLDAVAAFLLRQRQRAPLWPTVLAAIVAVATLCQTGSATAASCA